MQITRWAGIAAIVFAVLLFAGFLFASDTPDGDASDQSVAAYWNDGGNEMEAIISAYLLSVSAIALLTFTTLAFRGRGGSQLVALARSLGLVVATAFGIGAFALAAPAASALFDNATISAEGSSIVSSLGFGMMTVFGAIVAAAMIAAISVEWLRTKTMPAWLSWFGFVCAVLLLFGIVFFPMIALPLWALVTGIVMLRRPAEAPLGAALPA